MLPAIYHHLNGVRPFAGEFDRLFERFFGPSWREEHSLDTTWTPRVDINEQEDKFTLKIDLPGVEKKDISVNLEDGRLTVTGERKFEQEEDKDHYHRIERSYGRFSRTFTVPTTVEANKIKATYTHGVLELALPKSEKALPREIKVEKH